MHVQYYVERGELFNVTMIIYRRHPRGSIDTDLWVFESKKKKKINPFHVSARSRVVAVLRQKFCFFRTRGCTSLPLHGSKFRIATELWPRLFHSDRLKPCVKRTAVYEQ